MPRRASRRSGFKAAEEAVLLGLLGGVFDVFIRPTLEPQDVEDSEYRCWRRDGSRIQLTVRDGRILASDSEETGSAKDLFEALIAYAQLRKVDLSQPVAAHKADPSMLLRFIEEHAREQSWWRRLLRAFSR